jgi:hypothetical protein
MLGIKNARRARTGMDQWQVRLHTLVFDKRLIVADMG